MHPKPVERFWGCVAKRGYQLCDFGSLPEYLRDNEFILRHYRANWPLKQTLLSVFHIHNETGNIWTHLAGFFLFLTLTIFTAARLPPMPDLSQITKDHFSHLPSLKPISHLPPLDLLPNLTSLHEAVSKLELPNLAEMYNITASNGQLRQLAALYRSIVPQRMDIPKLRKVQDAFAGMEVPSISELKNRIRLPFDFPFDFSVFATLHNLLPHVEVRKLLQLQAAVLASLMHDLSNLPSLPSLPNLPNLPNLPSMPNMPHLPNLPTFAGVREKLGQIELPNFERLNFELPDLGEIHFALLQRLPSFLLSTTEGGESVEGEGCASDGKDAKTTNIACHMAGANNRSSASSEPESLRINPPITRWPMFIFLGGAMLCLLSSSTCHLLSCHSAVVSSIIWRFDYAGIAALISTSFFPPVYYGFLCQPLVRNTYLTTIVIVGFATIAVSLIPAFQTTKYRTFRASLFFGMGISGVIPCAHKLIFFYHIPTVVATTLLEGLMGALYGLGALFYATRVPERWLPGKFDIAGHSHQIFHILVVAGAFTHYQAGLLYLNWRDAHGCS